MEEAVADLTEVAVHSNSEVKKEMATTSHIRDVIFEDVATTEVKNEFGPPILQDEELLFTSDGHYICDICGETFSVRRSAEQHMIAHYEKIAEEPVDAATNDVTMTDSIEPTVTLVQNEPSNEPMKFQLIEIKSEFANGTVTNEVQNAVAAISQPAESLTSDPHYNCDICGLILFHRNSIEEHIGSHFDGKPFECYICTYNTNEKQRIVSHMITHFGLELGTKLFACSACNFETKERSHLTRHMLTHSGVKPFACDICGFRFNRKDSLQKHRKVHKKKSECSTAEYEAESDSHSSRHTSGSASSELDHRPNSATASSAEEVDSSIAVKLEPTDVAMEDATHVSNSAIETSKDVTAPVQLVVMIENPDATSNQSLGVIKVESDPPNEQLQLKMSQDWGPLRNTDPAIQVDDNIITCNICNYSTNKKYKYKLREHMNVHTGERPFACDLCDSRFSRKRNLDRHKMSHSGESPFACKLCDYAGKSKSLLAKHMKTHLGYENSNGNESNEVPNDQLHVGLSMNDSQSTTGDDVMMLDSHHPSVDALQLRLNEEHSQDSGLSSSSGPKVISACSKRFKCDICSYKTDRKYEFEVHLRTHTGETPFACEFCDKRYISRKTLNRHRKTHLREKRCGLCDFRTTQDSDLAAHMKTHAMDETEGHFEPNPLRLELREEHSTAPSSSQETIKTENKMFTCDVCGFETEQKLNFESHLMTHSGMNLFPCDFCGRSYAAKRTLDRHIRANHGGNLFDCVMCDFKSVKKSDLAEHMKTHVKPDSDPLAYDSSELALSEVGDNGGPSGFTPTGATLLGDEHFTCVHCDFETDDITAWSEHMFKHTNEKSWSCDQCEFTTKLEASMDVHRMSHAEKVPTVKVTCEFCDYPFTTKADMNQHLLTCHSELYSCCDVCDFKALNKRSLELHKATHTNIYKCNICDYKVDKEPLLTRHAMTAHADVGEYACSSCDFKAIKINDVEQHILAAHSSPADTPTNEIDASIPLQPDVKQYKCYACDFKAFKISQVEQHILSTHAVLLQDMATPLLTPESSGNHVDTPSSSNIDLEVYSCYACDYEASTVAQVEQHILSAHNPPMSETTPSPMDVSTEAPSSITSL